MGTENANLTQDAQVFIPPAPPAQASNDPLDAAPHVQVHANRCCADADAGPQLVQQQLPMPPPPPPRRQLRQSSNRSTWSSPSFGGLPDFSSFADDDEVAPVPTAPGAQSQPQPEPELAESGALMISTKVEYAAIPGGESHDESFFLGRWRHGRDARCHADAQDATLHEHECVFEEPLQQKGLQGHVLHLRAGILGVEVSWLTIVPM